MDILREMTREERDAFEAASVAAYAGDLVKAGQATAQDAAGKALEEMRAMLQNEAYAHRLYTIANGEGEGAGFLWVTEMPADEMLYISDLLVYEPHRGQGLATRAMRAVEQAAQELGWPIMLHVHAHNLPARRLYERLGYRVVVEEEGSLYMQKGV